jgi:hypothetical protein
MSQNLKGVGNIVSTIAPQFNMLGLSYLLWLVGIGFLLQLSLLCPGLLARDVIGALINKFRELQGVIAEAAAIFNFLPSGWIT